MAEEVKDGSHAARRRGISRHLEGWQPGLVAVTIALLAALLGVPRPVAPDVLPLPRVDVRELERSEAAARALARQALGEPLPFEVRAVGEAFRRFGAANAAQRTGDAEQQLLECRGLARGALARHGEEALERLQALQTEMFLDLSVRWERGEDVEPALGELGGNFVEKAKSAGWLDGARHLRLTLAERRVLFKVRWADVTGLRDKPRLAPTANDWRLYYRFLLLHPEPSAAGRPAEQQLRYVPLVERIDPGYPGAFARGVLYYRLGAFAQAAAAFEGHLAGSQSGPWRLRARNHLVAARERAREASEAPLE